MASIPLEDLLHKTIRDLHTLHLFSLDQSEAEYESLLLETIKSILKLLNYDDKYYRCVDLHVSSSHSDIGPLSFLYYIDKQQTSTVNKPFNSTNIIQFIQSSNAGSSRQENEEQFSRPYVISQLLKILSRHNKNNDRKAVRLKESYSLVLLKFSELVEFFAKFYSKSELKLIEYLNKSFTRELRFFTNLRNRLDEELLLGYEETEKIVEILDSFISIPEPSDDSDNGQNNDLPEEKDEQDDSIFSYDEENLNLDGHSDPSAVTPVGFESTDQTFSRLYQVFVQISGLKNEHFEGEFRDHREYLKLMIGFYKKHNSIDSLEINDFKFKELKFNFFYKFLMGNPLDSEHSLLPSHFKNASQRVISKLNIFPEIDKINDYEHAHEGHLNNAFESSESLQADAYQRPSSPLTSNSIAAEQRPVVQAILPPPLDGNESFNQFEEQPSFVSFLEYSREDQVELFLGLSHIVPLLNEFDLNFHPSFPLVFRHYMKLLYEEIPETSEQADLEYIERIVTLVNTITEFENADDSQDTLDIKDTVFSFYEEHQNLMKGEFSAKASSPTLLMRLAAHEFAANHHTKKLILFNWNYRTLYLGQLEYNLVNKFQPVSNAFCQRLHLKQWFGKLQRFKTLESVSSKYSQNRVKVKFLRDHWVPSLILIGNSHITANKFFLRRFFDSWLAMSKQKLDQVKIATLHDTKRRATKSMSRWIHRFNGIVDLQSRADTSRDVSTLKMEHQISKIIWKLWYDKMNLSHLSSTMQSPSEASGKQTSQKVLTSSGLLSVTPGSLSEKLLKLRSIEKYCILKKFFKRWKVSHTHQAISADVIKSNKRRLVEYVFRERWIKNYEVSVQGHLLAHEKDIQIKAQTFLSWQKCANLRKLADSFHKTTTAIKVIRLWKQHALHSYILRTDGTIFNKYKLGYFFKKWKMSLLEKSLDHQRQINVSMRIYQTWLNKTAVHEKNHITATTVDISTLLSNHLHKWNRGYRLRVRLLEVADLNFQRKFFNHLLAVRHHYAVDYRNVADHVAGNGSSFEARLTLATAFRRWKQIYAHRFEILAQKKVIYFRKKVVDPSTKFTFLARWVKKYNANYRKRTELEKCYYTFVQNSQKREVLFHKWLGRANEIRDLNQKSVEFEAYLLYKKIVVIWYDQLMNKVIYLNEVADDFTNKKEYITVRDVLRRWSMKYIKSSRNQQTCEMFLRRWEVSKARSILELWLQKAQERPGDLYLMGNESNSSLIPNQSPLANKSSRSAGSDQIDESGMSYLYTPVKLQVTRSPSTPFRGSFKNISPSKLLETNRKVKAERLESLRSHFSKAKRHSTPTKKIQPLINSLVDTTGALAKPGARVVRLSPPRREQLQKPVNPPKAPVFANLKAQRREPSQFIGEPFMANESYTVASHSTGTSTFFADEEEEIENAKKLKRITPIFIPPDNDEEPRFSPVGKLKERLKYNMAFLDGSNSNEMFE